MQKTGSQMTYAKLSALFLLVLSHIAMAESSLKPFTAHYQLEKSGITIANITMSLSEKDDIWTFKTSAKAKGFAALFRSKKIEQTGRAKLSNNTVLPLEYLETNQDKNVRIIYQDNKASVTINDETIHIALDKPHYDNQTLQLSLISDLIHNKPINSYPIIDDTELKVYPFKVSASESINTSQGKFEATKIVRDTGKRKTASWYAHKLNYLPVQIDQHKNGKLKSSMKLKSYSFQ